MGKGSPSQIDKCFSHKETVIKNRHDAYEFLEGLNAPPRLIEHLRLVWEAGEILVSTLREMGLNLDYQFIEIGIAVHDAGKIIHTKELFNPGSKHEWEGQRLLLAHGIPEKIARVCLIHGQWRGVECTLEELVIVLADKLWKGKREGDLEIEVIDRVADQKGVDRWAVFTELDSCFEAIAVGGQERLNRSAGI